MPAPEGEDREKHVLNTQQARQGVTLGHMRYVLAVSLVLVVIAFLIIYLIGP